MAGDGRDASTRNEGLRSATVSVDDRASRVAINAGEDGVVGTRLAGRYVIEARLGAGGMGLVYAARDLELERRVAIKLVRPRVDDGAGRERMVREARTMAKLRHPNVVTVFDIGTVDDRIFIVMELIEGGTLASWLRAQPRSWRDIVRVFLQALAGLAAAHAAGLVHRDFKPANVLLGRDGSVHVTDFGLARIVQPPDADAASSADPVAVSGTPGYIAPELLRNQGADARADQFSACVALHVALFGRHPVAGAAGPPDPLDASGAHEPPADRRRAPRWLAHVVARGLHRDPEQRWPSIPALTHAIERRLRPGRWTVLAAVGAVVVLTGLFAVVRAPDAQRCRGAERKLAGVWDAERKREVRAALLATGRPFAEATFAYLSASLDRRTDEWIAMHTESCEATHERGERSQDALDLQMACLERWRGQLAAEVELLATADPDLVARVPQLTAALSTLRQCADLAGLRAPRPPPLHQRAQVRAQRDRLAQVQALQAAAKAKAGLAIAEPAAAAARALAYRPLEAEAHYRLGLLQRLAGDLASAYVSFEQAMFAARAGRDTHAEIQIAAALASWSAAQARLDEGHLWVRRGEAAAAALEQPDLDAEATLLASAAELAMIEGKLAVALDYDRRVLALRVQLDPPDSVAIASALTSVGRELHQLQRHAESLAALRPAIAMFEARLGAQHPKVAWAALLIANVLGEQGDLVEAIATYRRAIAIYEAAIGPHTSELVIPLANLGAALAERGAYDEALVHLRRARDITIQVKRADHPDVALATMNIADAFIASGRDLAGAEREARSALALLRASKLAPGHHRIARALTILGHAQLELHQLAAAESSLVEALAMPAVRPHERPQIQFLLARVRWDAGRDRPAARALASEARRGFAALGDAHAKSVAELDAWLADHR